jgi:capsular polysaccharide biosynthesis protein
MVDQPPNENADEGGRVGRSSFLRRNLALIALCTIAVTVGSVAYSATRSAKYTANTRVLVQPLVLPGDVVRTPDMGTQKAVAKSQVVLSGAARALRLPESTVDSATSVGVPVDANLLVFGYTASSPSAARDGATAVANSYVVYTNGKRAPDARLRTDVPSVPGLQASVISGAGLPSAPSSHMVLNLIAGIAVGLLLGVLAAFASDRAGTRMRSVARWQDVTGVPALLARRRGWSPDRLDGVASLFGLAPDSGIDHARIRISRALPETAGILLVASSCDHSLAEVVPRQLAVAFAWAGRRAVLIEADAERTQGGDSSDAGDSPSAGRMRSRPGRVRVVATWAISDRGCESYAEPQTTTELCGLISDLAAVSDVVVVAAPPMDHGLLALDIASVASVAVLAEDTSRARRATTLAAIRELDDAGCAVRGGVLTGLDPWRRTDTSSAVVGTIAAPVHGRPAPWDLGSRRPLPLRDGLEAEAAQSVNHVRVPSPSANGRD